ncbi:MAG: NosD domain-containing protein [Methanomassiliicoccales archaeon]|jgi:parallel beta-helix repeat protein
MKSVTSRTFLVFIYISFIVSIIASLYGIGVVQANGANSTTLSSSPVIRVNNDTDLASLIGANHWNGAGIESNPYIIENLGINGTGIGDTIYIGNISSHLIIRNCNLDSDFNGSYPYNMGAGITLFNVTSALLENDNCSGNLDGIDLYYSSNNTITNNIFNGSGCGLNLYSSNHNIVSNNIGHGIGLEYSSNNTITNNSFSGIAVGIELSFSSNNNTIANNNCSGTHNGINLIYSNNNTITNNTCRGSIWGINLVYSNFNTITNNTCRGDSYDIYLDSSNDNNHLFGNIGTVLDKTGTGSSGSNNFDDLFPVVLISFVLLIIVIVFVLTGKKRQ